MLKKVKYGKILAVVFLTLLIWVWADLALDEELTVYGAEISAATSSRELWVTFGEESSVSIEQIVLKGPAARIAEMQRKIKQGKMLKFDVDVVQEKMVEPGSHSLVLLPVLQKDRQIKELGLKVESCKPDKLLVKVVGLVEKPLEVRCVDGDRNPVIATVDPTHVDMYVSEDWADVAEVQLSRKEIDQARVSPIEKIPFVRLAGERVRRADRTVKITVSPEEEKLRAYSITSATIGFVFSPVLQEKYRVELLNQQDMAIVHIKATPTAKGEYERQPFQMLLYILDDDAKKGQQEQGREVVYNFPPEFFREGEIELQNPQQPARAKFKLIELKPAPSPEAASGESR